MFLCGFVFINVNQRMVTGSLRECVDFVTRAGLRRSSLQYN